MFSRYFVRPVTKNLLKGSRFFGSFVDGEHVVFPEAARFEKQLVKELGLKEVDHVCTLNDDVNALKAEIEGYRVRLEAATPDQATVWAALITATRNNLTELLKAQAATVGASGKHLPPLCSHASFCVRL
jgi:hypothetical protein